jgi:hypothetical protein
MREFGTDYLFRITVKPTDAWSRVNGKKLKPFYVVSANKDAAREYAERHLRGGLKVSAVSLLAEQYGGNMFGGNY